VSILGHPLELVPKGNGTKLIFLYDYRCDDDDVDKNSDNKGNSFGNNTIQY
jgi:hypothetical protein